MAQRENATFLAFHLIFSLFWTPFQFNAALSESEALLKWKQSLLHQPILDSWVLPPYNNNNISKAIQSPCSWCGITCDNSTGSVIAINLAHTGLEGTLQNLNLFAFPNLLHLNLTTNNLTGSIPESIGVLSKLQILDLSTNILNGTLPLSLANLTQLHELNVSRNHITGTLDPCLFPNDSDQPKIGLIRIRNLLFQGNKLSGRIPKEIGNIRNLTVFALNENSFYGPIPASLGNCTHLSVLRMSENQLSGMIPPSVGRLTNLSDVRFHMNHLYGPVPQEFGNLSSLIVFHLAQNNFTGEIPPQICKGGKLANFCAAHNNFIGPIPISLRNCTSLVRVRLEHNQLIGYADQDFGVYPNLNYIDISYNRIRGKVSANWGACKSLQSLIISGNAISGTIPDEIFQLDQLVELDLSSNQIFGEIPPQVGNFSRMSVLSLSSNKLSGFIPTSIGKLSNLQTLDLSSNMLRGQVPSEIGDCTNLLRLNLSNNHFVGKIPHQIENLGFLQEFLDLSYNSLFGEIPEGLSKLKSLINLNMSHNNLSGPIPNGIMTMLSLSILNLSYNNLEGPIHGHSRILNSSNLVDLSHNKNLCGRIQGLKPCNVSIIKPNGGGNKRKVVILVTTSIASALILLSVLLWTHIIRGKRNSSALEPETRANRENLFSIWNFDGKILYEDIIEATENFHGKYCIGEGAFGKVYKLMFPGEERVFAVKKLIFEEDSLDIEKIKAFESEVKSLTETRHRNIVKLYGFCSQKLHTFFIYDYMERGSLFDILRNDKEAFELDWAKRVEIIKGVAQAISYMHHDCNPAIVHRDISSKNVLLSANFEAHVSDFGTARFLNPDSTIWTTFAGTYGYAAPELAYTMVVTEKVDVYSFGVLAIEVLMGKHPSDLLSNNQTNGINQISFQQILDPRLSSKQRNLDQLALIWSVGISCLETNPRSRPTMRSIAQIMEIETAYSFMDQVK